MILVHTQSGTISGRKYRLSPNLVEYRFNFSVNTGISYLYKILETNFSGYIRRIEVYQNPAVGINAGILQLFDKLGGKLLEITLSTIVGEEYGVLIPQEGSGYTRPPILGYDNSIYLDAKTNDIGEIRITVEESNSITTIEKFCQLGANGSKEFDLSIPINTKLLSVSVYIETAGSVNISLLDKFSFDRFLTIVSGYSSGSYYTHLNEKCNNSGIPIGNESKLFMRDYILKFEEVAGSIANATVILYLDSSN